MALTPLSFQLRGGARAARSVVQASWLFGLAIATVASAANPPSGTLSGTNPSLTWTGAPIAGANLDETTCNEGVTCDTYTLTLARGDYANQRITLGITWLIPTNDFDLYVHQDTADGPIVAESAGGAPSTSERVSIPIDPSRVTKARVYVVRVVAFSVTPGDIYSGDASFAPTPPPRVANYVAGKLTFSPNVTVRAPEAARDCEPSIRVDVRGNCYVGGIRGVPAGVDLWRFDLNPASPDFDPGLQHPAYLGQPDAFAADDQTGGADGGGDVDLAVSFPTSADSIPVITIVSLAAADVSSARSYDRGENFILSPAVADAPADDRQWIEADGNSRLYLLYRAPIPATGLFVQRSDDHGATYPVASLVSPSGTTPGYIDVNHATGAVYVAHSGSASLSVGRSTDSGVTWKNTTVDNTTAHGSLFDVVKVGDDGTVYALWCDEKDIYLAHSTDGGQVWSQKVRVNDNRAYQTNVFPWLEAGSAGRVDVVWYGTTTASNADASDWVVLFAQSTDASAPTPTFRQQVISDHVIHGSNISLGGLTGADNRNLCDYFQIAPDPQGAAVVAFTDDHNDYDGHTYVTRQLDGASLYASANGSGTVLALYPPPPPAPDPASPEVTDFLHDAVTGLLQPIPADDPFDILWIDYASEDAGSSTFLVATMKVSQLAPIPAAANWRMSFTANAPGGVSDHGDQFWVRANTDNLAAPVFSFGTAVRNGDGSLSYTTRGDADIGAFDAASSTVTIKVALAKLNPWVTHGPPIGSGSVLDGLRGQTFTTGANAVRDLTRGGRSFTVRSKRLASKAEAEAVPAVFHLNPPAPNPGGRGTTIELSLPQPAWTQVAVYDIQGGCVRTLHAGLLPAGVTQLRWDGRAGDGQPVGAGVYFVRAFAGGKLDTRKLVLLP